jgi:uncharacterized protein YeaO (DUF488 family)
MTDAHESAEASVHDAEHGLRIERIYGSVPRHGERRVLVDRLWPRGTSKAKAALDEWDKQIAPSNDLRQWFGHDPAKWEQFSTRYRAELESNPDAPAFAQKIRSWLADGPVVLLFGAKDEEHNNAVVLKQWLEEERRGQ